MPTPVLRALRALCLAALVVALTPTTATAAQDVVAELRVIAPGVELEPGAGYVTNTEKIKTDPEALCFIGGEGGSGQKAELRGPTAMGLLETAGDVTPAVDPLSVTDEFGFGLGLCAIGEVEADESNFWSLTVNHQASQIGGDQVTVEDGDVVLWHLTEFPPDPELELRAGPGTSTGEIDVEVVRWTCSTEFPPPPPPICTESPAEGATVTGGEESVVTDSSGEATVAFAGNGDHNLQATLADHLPSNHAGICVSDQPGACPGPNDPPGATIQGRRKPDRFSGTEGWDEIRARGGDDRVDLSDGGHDMVDCGGGTDKVLVAEADDDDQIASNCERVRAPR